MAVCIVGLQTVDMVKCPAIQEQPLHTAIAGTRDWNSALQRAAVITQALAPQQAALAAPDHVRSSAAASESSTTAGGAQHAQRAQQGGAAEEGSPGSASSSEMHASASGGAQRAGQGQQFKSAEAKHAQQGAGAPAGQPPDKADASNAGQMDWASPTQRDGGNFPHLDPQHESTTANDSHVKPQPQPSVASRAHPQSDAQPQAQGMQSGHIMQSEHIMQSGHSMPASLPPMEDVHCVLGNGEQLSMLDGLQALVTALNVKYQVLNAARVSLSMSIKSSLMHCLQPQYPSLIHPIQTVIVWSGTNQQANLMIKPRAATPCFSFFCSTEDLFSPLLLSIVASIMVCMLIAGS